MKVKDPSCGMDVDPNKSEKLGLTSVKNNKKYYFCSKQCKDKFEGKKEVKSGKEKAVIQIGRAHV